MPLFNIHNDTASQIESTNFDYEKQLQNLVEKNLKPFFNCRFVASEFTTGSVHSGRIDTLALSEDNNPVIIEYKKVESSELVTQSLFYLHWIKDHKGDFEIAVNKALGNGSNIEVDWSDIRVMCIAPNYKKYDIHAVEVMGANIELWQYRLYGNSTLHLERILLGQSEKHKSSSSRLIKTTEQEAETRSDTEDTPYTWEYHLESKPKNIQSLAQTVRDFILGIDDSIEENYKKFYITYGNSQNIVCMEFRKNKVTLYLKLSSNEVENPPSLYRDMKDIGHFGTGDAQFSISSLDDFEATKPFIIKACNKFIG
jgi:predicted transport protein